MNINRWKIVLVFFAVGAGVAYWFSLPSSDGSRYKGRPQLLSPDTAQSERNGSPSTPLLNLKYKPRFEFDSSGFYLVGAIVPKWSGKETLQEVADIWNAAVTQNKAGYAANFANDELKLADRIQAGMTLAILLNYEANPYAAYELLLQVRKLVERDSNLMTEWLSSVIYMQGVTGLRCGENDNCVMCLGDGACIFPVRSTAIHQNRYGSETAVKHFSEYLQLFPDDKAAQWLLNLAHMTLGEYPDKVESRYLIELPDWQVASPSPQSFTDVASQVGLNRFNQAGGAIMDDFDNDGLLDLTTTAFDLTTPMSMMRNLGNGKYGNRAEHAGCAEQLGGLYCVQADYNNDGFLDIFIPRGAWLLSPLRPTLLENNGDGTFRDVTEASGLLSPSNSNSAAWADFNDDGLLDLMVVCERQPNKLYKNLGDGTFFDIAVKAGVAGNGSLYTKGAAWIDYNNDSRLDLFLNHYKASAQLFENVGSDQFIDVSQSMGVDGPDVGFSCWCWDYDQDGWQDIFATSYALNLPDAVATIAGQTHAAQPSRLFHNQEGLRFVDKAKEVGLDGVYGAMGSNFGDIDNDGFPDIYLATGEPRLETLIPNRLLKNLAGAKFKNVTAETRTGHLQKGHAVSFGDWDRDGDADLFVETGGAGDGDRFYNVLFQNPGNENNWLNLQLIGTQANRSAIGTRIKVRVSGPESKSIYQTVSTGSSFGANSLEQIVGLGESTAIESVEIEWNGSGIRQVLTDIPVNSAIQVIEGQETWRLRDYNRIKLESAE